MSVLYVRDKNGNFVPVQTIRGKPGADGYTPQKGVDYWTAADREEILKDFAEDMCYVTPEMYGAVGDGVTDDSAAIQAAIDAAGNTLGVYLANKTYCIGTGIVISTNYAVFRCDGELTYTGDGDALTIRSCYRANVYVHKMTAANGTAIKLDGSSTSVYSCNIQVDYIRSSVTGVHLYTNSASVCYNTLRITELTASGTGVLVWAEASFIKPF